MPKPYQITPKAAEEVSPWSPFWAAVRRAAEELRQGTGHWPASGRSHREMNKAKTAKTPRWNGALCLSHNTGPVRDALKILPDFQAILSSRPLYHKGDFDMKRPPTPNTTGCPGPRRPDLTPQDILDIASLLQARQRTKLTRLSPLGRLRRW